MELASSQGKISGYAKPIIYRAETIKDYSEVLEEEGLEEVATETFSDAAIAIFEDDEHGRVATRIPLSGRLKNPQTSPWVAIWKMSRNVIFETISPGLRDTVEPPDVLAEAESSSFR